MKTGRIFVLKIIMHMATTFLRTKSKKYREILQQRIREQYMKKTLIINNHKHVFCSHKYIALYFILDVVAILIQNITHIFVN